MKTIVINNRTYRYADRLEELTLEQWQALMKYRPQETASADGSDQESLHSGDAFLMHSLGIQDKIRRQTDPQDRERFLRHWSKTITRQSAEGLENPDGDHLRETARKSCKKEKIDWPDDSHTPHNQRKPLSGICAQAFCDATDLYLENPVEHAPYIVSILGHRSGRAYDETKITAHAHNMRRCRMQVVMALFRELVTAHQRCRSWFPACYQNRLQEHLHPDKQPQPTPRWNDMLLWLADYRPSEIKATEQLPCYEFMRMLDSKLRSRPSALIPQTTPTHV